MNTLNQEYPTESDPESSQYLSAKASRPEGRPLTEAEIEAAEEEAHAWARRANSC
jgi:hypothetical protein